MPVWHEATSKWVQEGKLALLGVTQEQHAERCRLFAQWKQFDWPILHDPINVLRASAVPIVVAIDEHGIVRSTRPDPKTFEATFLNRTFEDDVELQPQPLTPPNPNQFGDLKAAAENEDSPSAWRQYGDALALWGEAIQLSEAIAAYRTATVRDPRDGPAFFRLGVCQRKRFESPFRKSEDFRSAVASWSTALELDPNQYIWRRRIQQYGPRLDKPYPFYDWVPEAEAAIHMRGEMPVALPVRPGGAEIAAPLKSFATEQASPKSPDPDGKVKRDAGSVESQCVLVPPAVKPGQSARVHVTLRLAPKARDHWNNEAEPLRLWVDSPDGYSVSARLLEVKRPIEAVSDEERMIEFEIKAPSDADGTVRVPAYALFHLCDDDRGQCRFVRHDLTIEVAIKR